MATGLVAEWSFTEGTGGTISDSSGNGHDLTRIGSISWIANGSNFAMEFPGNSGDRLNLSDHSDFDLNNAFTLMAWVRPDDTKTMGIIQKRSSGVDGWDLSISSGGVPFCRINQGTNGNDFRVDAGGSITHDGETWTHIAATFDGTDLSIYINGEFEDSIDASSQTVASNNNDVWVGDSSSSNGAFLGALDDVRVFSIALSEQEIQAWMNLEGPIVPVAGALTVELPSLEAAFAASVADDPGEPVEAVVDVQLPGLAVAIAGEVDNAIAASVNVTLPVPQADISALSEEPRVGAIAATLPALRATIHATVTLTGTYSFFPPFIVEQPLAHEPEVLRRFRWPRGISVVRDGPLFVEKRHVTPQPGWIEGRDYFVGGHHYSNIPSNIAMALIASGFEPVEES